MKKVEHQTLYNALQDGRHCVLIDLRQGRPSLVVRGSIMLWQGPDANSQNIQASTKPFLRQLDAKNRDHLLEGLAAGQSYAQSKEALDKAIKPLRRYFILYGCYEQDKQMTAFYQRVTSFCQTVLQEFKKEQPPNPQNTLQAVYEINGGIDSFIAKFPFLCHNRDKIQQLEKQGKQIKHTEKTPHLSSNQSSPTRGSGRPILTPPTPLEVELFYSLSKFPTMIISDKLYIGSYACARNKRQLVDLRISLILDLGQMGISSSEGDVKTKAQQFNPWAKEKKKDSNENQNSPSESIRNPYENHPTPMEYLHLPLPQSPTLAPLVDFEFVCSNLLSAMEEGKRVLITCSTLSLSAGIAMAQLMNPPQNMKLQIATVKVSQAMGCVGVAPWLHRQLMAYEAEKNDA